MNNKYDDIIDLPHFVSKNRRHMSNHDRAAQFAPFAALSGYAQDIEEASRFTEEFVELGEQERMILDEKLMILQELKTRQHTQKQNERLMSRLPIRKCHHLPLLFLI